MTDSEHEPERELEELEAQSESLGDRVSEARDEWERKKADPAVPGAGGDPLAAHSAHPEDQYPAKGSSGEAGEDLREVSAHADLDDRDPENEDL